MSGTIVRARKFVDLPEGGKRFVDGQLRREARLLALAAIDALYNSSGISGRIGRKSRPAPASHFPCGRGQRPAKSSRSTRTTSWRQEAVIRCPWAHNESRHYCHPLNDA